MQLGIYLTFSENEAKSQQNATRVLCGELRMYAINVYLYSPFINLFENMSKKEFQIPYLV